MGAKENIELQQRVLGHFSRNEFDAVLALAREDVVVEMLALGQIHKGHAGFLDFMHSFKGAFPDLRIEIRNQVADETRVAAEFLAIGTHTGPLVTPAGEVAPTGRRVTFTVSEFWDVKAGKLAGIRNYQDIGSVLRQLGAA